MRPYCRGGGVIVVSAVRESADLSPSLDLIFQWLHGGALMPMEPALSSRRRYRRRFFFAAEARSMSFPQLVLPSSPTTCLPRQWSAWSAHAHRFEQESGILSL